MIVATERLRASEDQLSVPYVELSFGVRGKTLPADHGYGLYGAISRQNSILHNLQYLAINTIHGNPNGKGTITLTEKSRLRIRCRADDFLKVLPLAGCKIEIDGHDLRLSNPEIYQPRTFSELKARLVTIKHPSKNHKDITPDWFLDACNRQLEAFGITASVGIPMDEADELARKTMRVKRKKQSKDKQTHDFVVGYSVIVANLLPQDSILLQAKGLGGKRKMGCGYFVPYRLA